jgi:hypothetical protein
MLWNTIINTFPLPPPLAIIIHVVIVIIVHLMIVASPALPFRASSNPATPSPQSQWQIVSFWGGVVGAQNWDLHVESHPSSTFDCRLFHRFRCNSCTHSERIAAPWRGRGGWPHRNASPPPRDRRPRPLPRPSAWLLLLLPPALFRSC